MIDVNDFLSILKGSLQEIQQFLNFHPITFFFLHFHLIDLPQNHRNNRAVPNTLNLIRYLAQQAIIMTKDLTKQFFRPVVLKDIINKFIDVPIGYILIILIILTDYLKDRIDMFH